MNSPTRCVCEWCGATFVRPAARGPKPKFCSPSHRQAAYHARTFVRRQS